MANPLSRREFVAAAGGALALGCASRAPLGAASGAGARADLRAKAVVLFQGDSITDGGRDRAAAAPNVAAALGTGYPLLVASALLRAYPERGLRFYNRGVSGNKVPELQARWEADALALAPDVLSVLVGVNDFWHKRLNGYAGTVADYETQYVALLEATCRALPGVRLVVLEPFVLRAGVVDETWFPEFDERRATAARVARRVGATFVPLQAQFDELAARTTPAYWAADGVHPTPAGHALIAERWRAGVGL
jgi:lysophospholipase L1-like esterase